MLTAAIAAVMLVAGCDRAASLLAPAVPPTGPGQTGPAIQIGAGNGPAGPWTGWLYPTADGACVDTIDGNGPGEHSCQSGGDPFDGSVGINASAGARGAWAWGSTVNPAATVAAITDDAGTTVRVPLLRPAAAMANGNGYFVTRLGTGRQAQMILLLDANNVELDRYPMGR